MEDNTSYSQTAGRALDILTLFRKNDQLTLSAVVKLTGLSTTIAYRLLYTLTVKGFLKQDTLTKSYSLGTETLLMGYAAVRLQSIKVLAQPILHWLTEETGQESFLNVCVGQESLCLDKVSNGEELQTSAQAGMIAPLHRGATNRVLLAFLTEEEQRFYLENMRESADKVKRLAEEIKVIRRRGYDYSEGQLSRGLFSIAYPILGENGKLIASISVAGSAFSITSELKERCKKHVMEAADKLSKLSGA